MITAFPQNGVCRTSLVFGATRRSDLYTHTDIIARFQRMVGKSVFYPMGWDDNGLPTERRVQNFFGVRCDPSIPYDPDFVPPQTPPETPLQISRQNFVELCHRLTGIDRSEERRVGKECRSRWSPDFFPTKPVPV